MVHSQAIGCEWGAVVLPPSTRHSTPLPFFRYHHQRTRHRMMTTTTNPSTSKATPTGKRPRTSYAEGRGTDWSGDGSFLGHLARQDREDLSGRVLPT
jgi:hypothetical protein